VAWGVKDVSEQRLKFVIRAASGKEEMTALCREFEISRPTGYEWLARYRQCERVMELKEKSRRPHRSPHKTETAIEEQVAEVRQQYPDWGAKKLQGVLEKRGVKLPRITIHRILLRRGLVQEQDRHRPAVRRFERAAPNELWQMDFKGMPAYRSGCIPLTILDDCSRYLLGLIELAGTGAQPVQENLQKVLERDGVPDAMLMDHGPPWWNMHTLWGWTWLTVWLIKQGISVRMSGYRHPQTQGKVERCHGSLEAAMRKRPKPEGQSWQSWLDAFREEYNQVRPHEALGMQVPAQRWHKSPRCFQEHPPAWEYSDPANVRKVGPSGAISIDNRNHYVSLAFVGERVQVQRLEDRLLVYFCNTVVREIDLQAGTSHAIDYGQMQRIRWQGLGCSD
jgi:transposase InsO family protein